MPSSTADGESTIYQRPVELLQNLLRFDTSNPPGNEADCLAYVSRLLTSAGFEVTILSLDPARPNLVTHLAGKGIVPPLLLYGHLDVAPATNQTWKYPPFEGHISDGYVWGRGALDMKSGVAMMLAAVLRAKAENLLPQGDVLLTLVSDEEHGGDFGAKYLVENHASLFQGCKYAIGEFGGFTFYISNKRFYPIMVAEKQVCGIEATLRGVSGHPLSSTVSGGVTAKLADFLHKLDKHRLPVHITPAVKVMYQAIASALPFPSSLFMKQLLNPIFTDQLLKLLGTQGKMMSPLFHNTVCTTMVRSGEEFNVIPSEAKALLIVGLLPGLIPETVLTELRTIVGPTVELKIFRCDSGPSEPNMGLFETLAGILREKDPAGVPIPLVITAVTDARFFSKLGIQTYGFLPMKLPAELIFHKSCMVKTNASQQIA